MNKKNIILLSVGIVIFVIIITILILLVYKNSDLNSNNINTNIEENNTEVAIGTVSDRNTQGTTYLDITYKNNGLEFKSEQNTIESEQIEYEPIVNFSKYEITGLKNKEVQNKINNEVQGIINQYKNNFVVSIELSANFSDILSLDILVISMQGETSSLHKQISLNYRLDNGEKLQLKDLFKDDKSAKEALKQCLDNKLETYKDNQEIYQIMKSVNETEITNFDKKQYEFTFSTNEIVIYNIGSEQDSQIIRNLSIPLIDFADKVAIFTKYVSNESLYETENDSSEIKAFMPLNKYSGMRKLDDSTYVIQYYTGDISNVDKVKIEKMQNQADYDANKIKNQNSGYKVLVQNILEIVEDDKRYMQVNTALSVLKPEYFESNDFKLDIANGKIVEGVYIVAFDTDYIIYSNIYSSRTEL